MSATNQKEYLDKKEELKKKLAPLFTEKNKKKEEIRKALCIDIDTNQKANDFIPYLHRVVVEKEARQHLNNKFTEENTELLTAFKKLSEEQKIFINEKINLYQVEEAIKFYKELGVEEPRVFIMVAKTYERLWQHPTERNKDNTRKIDNKNNEETRYKNERAGILAAELYVKAGLDEKAGDIYTSLRKRIEAANAYEKAEQWEKAARAYSDAAFNLSGWKIYYEKAWEMYEKLHDRDRAYNQYTSFRWSNPEEVTRISNKLSELNNKIIKEYEEEGDLFHLASRYEKRWEKQLAAEIYEKSENWQQAQELYDVLWQKEKAIEMLKNYNNPKKMGVNIGARYEELKKWDDAIEAYKNSDLPIKALRLCLTHGKVADANEIFNDYKENRNREQIKKMYKDAGIPTPSRLKKTGMDMWENRTSKLAKAKAVTNRYSYKQALDIYIDLKERKFAWDTASKWADFIGRTDDEESRKSVKELRNLAIELYAKVEDYKSIAEEQEKIGRILYAESSNEKIDPEDEQIKASESLKNQAMEWYKKALENYRKVSDWNKVAIMYFEMWEWKNEYLTLLNHNIREGRWEISKNRREGEKAKKTKKNEVPQE